MTEVDIDNRLTGLGETLEKIKALLAWEQLKQDEARLGDPPAFIQQESIHTDLRHLYSVFLMQATEMRSLLDDQCRFILSAEQRGEYRRHFEQLDSDLKRLDLPARFINS